MTISYRERVAARALARADQHLLRARVATLVVDEVGRLRHLLDAASAACDAAETLACEAEDGPRPSDSAEALLDVARVRTKLVRARVGVTRE